MRWLLFLLRLGIICGLFFVLTLSVLVSDWLEEEGLVSTIITIGFFMGLLVVPFSLIAYIALWAFRRKSVAAIPGWLIFGNFMVLLLLLIYIVYINKLYVQSFL